MLVDNITIIVHAGRGGNGAATLKPFKGGPDGGRGGNGGNIYIVGSANVNDLRQFRYKKKIVAGNGGNGARQNMFGRKAEDVIIQVPLGTRVSEAATNDAREVTDDVPFCIARGGIGGRGNAAFKSPTNQTPRTAEQGQPGEEKELLLELRLIAEIGLVGLPNAGKSSLLTVLTNARPAVAAYPFTTLDPTIGMLDTHPIADIPGLIEGASKGKGLGLDFLRHIEKTQILLHCIDATTTDPRGAYETIRNEFSKFNPGLLTKPEYIVLTKTDLVGPAAITALRKLFKQKKIFTCSVYDEKAVASLKKNILKLL